MKRNFVLGLTLALAVGIPASAQKVFKVSPKD